MLKAAVSRLPGPDELSLKQHGAEKHARALAPSEIAALRALAESVLAGRSGIRLFGQPTLAHVLSPNGSVGRIAASVLGAAARPVRAILFDKTSETNWAVGWHQDRTIAVRARAEVDGFGPWSVKSDVAHAEPPFAVLAGMTTLRAHLDACDVDNAPLLIVPGSHRIGRVPADQAEGVARRCGSVSCLAAAGDVWAYATPILHASECARMPRRRRVFQVDYAAAALPPPLEWLGIA